MLLNQNYQHLSFDLWLTLIRSNPDFKKKRAAHFHQHFNYNNCTLEQVEHAFRQVDVMCNLINEKTGKNIDADEMYLMVLSMMNNANAKVWQINVNALYADMEALLFQNLPLPYSAETLNALAYLKQNTNATIGILSNTGFIKGVTLRKVLNQIGIDRYIDVQLYSDEVGMSKPNTGFFKMMLEQLKQHHIQVDLDRIIHIGDNPIADVGGANTVGIRSQLINSNHIYLTDIIDNAHHLLLT
ncbi:HAD family hydrolase [Mucilaginibacter auburnensis]|uniref:Putative hydrolase of the HAD superfamily n=1 Tax=Mucilaginibacter auburnensis TaxID=1457233 RepID=A0A2H9VQW5_9SPHI|nr:HAD-IA family hydrolase [Mucilaginibacter auburnensis]PJJ83210.1 putative hydrolase of the HAD superfamily [Mucilaginibacter auburnensis]